VIATLLGTVVGQPESLGLVEFVCALAIVMCIGSAFYILRHAMYQNHRIGILKDIEDQVRKAGLKAFNLYTVDINQSSTHSKNSPYHTDNLSKWKKVVMFFSSARILHLQVLILLFNAAIWIAVLIFADSWVVN